MVSKKIVKLNGYPYISLVKEMVGFLHLKEEEEFFEYEYISSNGKRFIAIWNGNECNLSEETIRKIEQALQEDHKKQDVNQATLDE